MTSYRETLQRHRILLGAPVAIAAVLALWFTLGTPKSYEATAGLWVDNPAPEPSSLTETNPELRTPAEQQQQFIVELLRTRSFRLAVGHKSPLAQYLASNPPRGWTPTALLSGIGGRPSVDLQIMSALDGKHVIAAIGGPQLMQLRLRGPTPAVVRGTLQALIEELAGRRVTVDVRRGLRTRAFYQKQVDAAQKGVSEARAGVAAYLRANPVATSDDPTLKASLRAQRVAGSDLARATTKLNQATSEVQGREANDSGVDVIDPPTAPRHATSGRMRIVEALIGGLFAGGLISLLGLVALTPARGGAPDPIAALDFGAPTIAVANGAGAQSGRARSGGSSGKKRRRRS